MRNTFARVITEVARENPNVVLLSGDIGNKLFDDFKDHAPGRFYNCGVAEANMIGVAAGLGLNGFFPFAYTITPFITTRCMEQIRLDVCYHESPVTIVGTGAGLSYTELGPTHHSLEDIAMLRLLPGMRVICPADPLEVELAVRAVAADPGPTYIRLGKKGEPILHTGRPDFKIGRAITLREGSEVCILFTGNIGAVALGAANLLDEKGISVRVESFHTVKPLDETLLARVFADYPLVVTLEEHNRMGGLGGSIAEWRNDHAPDGARLERIGTEDRFLHSLGSQNWSREIFGLTAPAVVGRIEKALSHSRAFR